MLRSCVVGVSITLWLKTVYCYSTLFPSGTCPPVHMTILSEYYVILNFYGFLSVYP